MDRMATLLSGFRVSPQNNVIFDGVLEYITKIKVSNLSFLEKRVKKEDIVHCGMPSVL